MRKKYIYLIGDVVDDMKVIETSSCDKTSETCGKYRVVCLKCGRTKLMGGHRLFKHNGTTHRSCGQGLKTLEPRFHSIWCNMRSRTTNPNTDHYKDYGGRGIGSDEFKNFIDFYDSMYASYMAAKKLYGDNVSLERIDVNKSYSKSNCKWIHFSEQGGNTRVTVFFEIVFPDGHKEIHKNVNKFAKDNGLNVSCLRYLLNGRLKRYRGFRGKRISRESVTTKWQECREELDESSESVAHGIQ